MTKESTGQRSGSGHRPLVAASGQRRRRHANQIVAGLAVAAAAGGALAGAHPTGNDGLDVAYSAALAGFITVAASRANRSTLLVASAVAFAMSRWWLWAPAGAAMGLAFWSTWQRRSHRRHAAVVGALLAQVVLRWPPVAFHGATALVAAAMTLLVAASAWRHTQRRIRHRALVIASTLLGVATLFTIISAVSTLLAKGPAEMGISLARQSLNQIEAGQTSSGEATVITSAHDLRRASSLTNGWWDVGGYLVPGVAQQQRALARSTRAGANLTTTAAAVATKLNYSALRYSGGKLDLAALSALGSPAKTLHASAAQAEALVKGTESSWLLEPIQTRIQSLNTEVTKVASESETAYLASEDGPGILGADGVRHYLVAFMTPAETRGLDGFVGAYGVLTVNDGHISLGASGDTSSLRQVPGATKVTGLAGYLARYGAFAPQDHFQDLTYAPDLPTDEDIMAQVFPQIGGQPIDGVMVIDPYVLEGLLTITGPISVPGFPTELTSADAADVLLRQQYLGDLTNSASRQRRDLLQAALSTGFTQLATGNLPSPKTLSELLGPDVRQGRLLFWTGRASDQALLDRLGLAGKFPRPGSSSDVLAVTIANAANNKIDAYLTQKTSYTVDYDPHTGRVASTVTIKLTNAAPNAGLPTDVIGSHTGSGLPIGTNLSWLCLYSPLSLERAALDSRLTDFSPALPQYGVNTYCTYVPIAPESTSTLTISLDGELTPGPTYRLAVRLQPLANPQTEAVQVAIGSARASSWTAGPDEVQYHSWK